MSKVSQKMAKGAAGQKVQPKPIKSTKSHVPFETADGFVSKLKKRSQWFQSIEDPLTGAGARIPDPSGYKSVCYQYCKRVTVPVNALGVAGLRVCTPYTASDTGGGVANVTGQYQVTGSTSSVSGLNWGDGTTTNNGLVFFEANAELGNGPASLASLIRPVSGAVYATYTGSSLNNAGTFVSYTNPAGLESNAVQDSRLRNLLGTSVLPVKANRAAVARLLPIQKAPTTLSGNSHLLSADYRSFRLANLSLTSEDSWFREFGVYATGCTPSVGSIDFLIVINWEFIPRFNTSLLVDASLSPSDPYEESFVLSTIEAESDSTGSITMNQFSKAPSQSKVVKAEEMDASGPLGFVSEAVGFLGPILEEAMPLVKALL